LAGGLSIVRKWLLKLNVSRLDVSLNNKYNSKGASLVKAIIKAMDETIKGEYVCRWVSRAWRAWPRGQVITDPTDWP
jgi:hypothetical protein